MGLFSGLGKILKAPLNLHKGIIRNAAPGNVKKNTMRLFGMGGGGGATTGNEQVGVPFMNMGSPMSGAQYQQQVMGSLQDPSMFMRPGAANFMARMNGMQNAPWGGGNPWGSIANMIGGKLPTSGMGNADDFSFGNITGGFPNMQQGTPIPQDQMTAYRNHMAQLMQNPQFAEMMGRTVQLYGGPGSSMGYVPGVTGAEPSPGPNPALMTMMQRYAGALGNGGGSMYPNAFRRIAQQYRPGMNIA